jgi:hypothetical protein
MFSDTRETEKLFKTILTENGISSHNACLQFSALANEYYEKKFPNSEQFIIIGRAIFENKIKSRRETYEFPISYHSWNIISFSNDNTFLVDYSVGSIFLPDLLPKVPFGLEKHPLIIKLDEKEYFNENGKITLNKVEKNETDYRAVYQPEEVVTNDNLNPNIFTPETIRELEKICDDLDCYL